MSRCAADPHLLRRRDLARLDGGDLLEAALEAAPEYVRGEVGWVRPGGVVIERTFAEALGVSVGDRLTLNGQSFTVQIMQSETA